MRILAIETSTSVGSVAVLRDGTLVSQLSESVPQRHLEWLAPAVKRLLAGAGMTPPQVEAVVVSTGPGSFTSVRIGIATAAMWARAHGIPAVGIPTLDVVAWGTSASGLVCAMLDVRRGEVAAAAFSRNGGLRRITEDVVGPVAAALARLPAEPVTVSGDALVRYAAAVTQARPDALLAPRDQWYPTAASAGVLGWQRLARGERDDLYRLWPTYVRAPADGG